MENRILGLLALAGLCVGLVAAAAPDRDQEESRAMSQLRDELRGIADAPDLYLHLGAWLSENFGIETYVRKGARIGIGPRVWVRGERDQEEWEIVDGDGVTEPIVASGVWAVARDGSIQALVGDDRPVCLLVASGNRLIAINCDSGTMKLLRGFRDK